jgi:hypothetical protein
MESRYSSPPSSPGPELRRYPTPNQLEAVSDSQTPSYPSFRPNDSDAANWSQPLNAYNRPVSFDSHPQFDDGDRVSLRLRSPFRQFFWTWALTIVSIIWVVFTVYFAYNCTMDKPLSTTLVFSRPDNTILALNILSHGTILLLRELTSSVFEAVRWAFASSKDGISAFSFLGLSRATSPLGVLNLMGGSARSKPFKFAKDGHRIWGFQRYLQAEL